MKAVPYSMGGRINVATKRAPHGGLQSTGTLDCACYHDEAHAVPLANLVFPIVAIGGGWTCWAGLWGWGWGWGVPAHPIHAPHPPKGCIRS